MIGKKYEIAGMTIKIIADAGDKWETMNLTTKELVFFDKTQLDQAVKLGKLIEVLGDDRE